MRVMKDSGIDWIKDIPSDWETSKLKYEVDWIESGGTPDSGNDSFYEGDIHFATIADITASKEVLNKTQLTISNEAKLSKGLRLYPAGTLLMSIYATLGATTRLGEPACINQAILAIQPSNKLDTDYLSYFIAAIRPQLTALSSANTQQNLSASKVKDLALTLPPISEQKRIVRELSERLKKLSSEEEALVMQTDLLERFKETLIHETVTKGLDSNAPLKPSDVEWIGDIPEHWNAERISYHARLESGHTPSTQHPEWWKEEECVIPWLTTADIHRFRDGKITTIYDTEEHVSQVGLDHSSARMLPAGTVGLSRTASVGFSIIMGTDMASSQDFADWVPDESLDSKYLLYTFRAMTEQFEQLKLGSTHKTIYMHVLKTLKMPIPPKEEQVEIAQYLDGRCSKVDAILEIKCEQVEILKKRRQSLIYEYVTGKRRVGEES